MAEGVREMKLLRKLIVQIGKFLVKNWMYIAAIGGIAIIARSTIAKIGTIDNHNKSKFVADPTDKHSILVLDEKNNQWVKAVLPADYESEDVQSAAIGESDGKVAVKIVHDRLTSVFDD